MSDNFDFNFDSNLFSDPFQLSSFGGSGATSSERSYPDTNALDLSLSASPVQTQDPIFSNGIQAGSWNSSSPAFFPGTTASMSWGMMNHLSSTATDFNHQPSSTTFSQREKMLLISPIPGFDSLSTFDYGISGGNMVPNIIRSPAVGSGDVNTPAASLHVSNYGTPPSLAPMGSHPDAFSLSSPFPTFDFQAALAYQHREEGELSIPSRSTSTSSSLSSYSPPQTPVRNRGLRVKWEERFIAPPTARLPKECSNLRRTHYYSAHLDPLASSGRHACRVSGCRWRFGSAAMLRRHMVTHKGTNSYFCPNGLCLTNNGKSKSGFPRRCSIRRHLRPRCDGNPCREAALSLGWTGNVDKDEEKFNPSSPDCVLYICGSD